MHSFGTRLNFDLDLHIMDTDGGFTSDGGFHPLPTTVSKFGKDVEKLPVIPYVMRAYRKEAEEILAQ